MANKTVNTADAAAIAEYTAKGGKTTTLPVGAAKGAVARNSQTAASLKAQAKAGKPARAPKERAADAAKPSNGIGKGWTGSTAVSRMTLPEVEAYHAYLDGIANRNARQDRHHARCVKALVNLRQGATYFGAKPETAAAE